MVERIGATDGKVSALYAGDNAQGCCLLKDWSCDWDQIPGVLYTVDPTELLGGPATKVSDKLGNHPNGIVFDGGRVWTANAGFPGQGSVSVISWDPFGNAQVSTVKAGFSHLYGMIFDGTNIWVTDTGDSTLKRLSLINASVEQTISVGLSPQPCL
jgi:DNA-binding beta-propeller fold protein YncE